MKEAQQKKDLELAERIKLADEKLASVTKLEQEMKAALGKKNDLEAFLSGLAKKLFLMLEGKPLRSTIIFNCDFPFDHCLDSVIALAEFCQDFEEETSRWNQTLTPSILR